MKPNYYYFLSAVFHLNSVGSNMTTLWAVEAGLYVGIDNRGNIVTSVSTFHARISLFSLGCSIKDRVSENSLLERISI